MPITEDERAKRALARRMAAALKEEVRHHRREAKRREWSELGMYLTREQAAAGEACRGCGLPVIDNLGDFPALMHLSPAERIEYDNAEGRFREQHADCDAYRWSMSGSRATHCGACCPPIPISPAQAEHISRLLASVPALRENELDVWERALTCGHQVERHVHHSNRSPSFSTEWCPACERIRGVVESIKTVAAEARGAESMRKRVEDLARAERDLMKAEAAVAAAQKKLAALRLPVPGTDS